MYIYVQQISDIANNNDNAICKKVNNNDKQIHQIPRYSDGTNMVKLDEGVLTKQRLLQSVLTASENRKCDKTK